MVRSPRWHRDRRRPDGLLEIEDATGRVRWVKLGVGEVADPDAAPIAVPASDRDPRGYVTPEPPASETPSVAPSPGGSVQPKQ